MKRGITILFNVSIIIQEIGVILKPIERGTKKGESPVKDIYIKGELLIYM